MIGKTQVNLTAVAILSFLESRGWTCSYDRDADVVDISYQGEHGPYVCFLLALEDEGRIVFYSACPVKVPEARRVAAAEFLMRANYGLTLGNFEMDFRDGEVRFKSSLEVDEDGPEGEPLQRVIQANVLAMDYYAPGIVQLAQGGESPAEVFARFDPLANAVAGDGAAREEPHDRRP